MKIIENLLIFLVGYFIIYSIRGGKNGIQRVRPR